MKRILKGSTASGKTKDAINRYNAMLNDNIDSNSILVLVSSRWEKYRWLQEINSLSSSSNNIHSYFAFVQKEISLYWPNILKSCPLIKKHHLKPVIMHFESSQSLMYKTIEFYRKKGFLEETISQDEAISRKLLSNIVGASLSNVNYKKIGEQIYLSKSEEERLSPNFYKEFNQIINKYIERTLAEGIVDQATAIYLYSNYLMKDPNYLKLLNQRFDFLIVDDLELASISEIDFIMVLIGSLKGSILYLNSDGPYGIYQFSRDYLESHLIPYFDIENIESNQNSSQFLKDFYISLFSKGNKLNLPNHISLEVDDDFKGKSDRRLLRQVRGLLDKGIEPHEISIISPKYDSVIDFGLSKLAEKYNIKYMYTSKEDKITDNPQVFSLIIFAIIFYKIDKITLNFDEVKSFLSFTLRSDVITSSILAEILFKKNYVFKKFDLNKNIRGVSKETLINFNSIVTFLDDLPQLITIDKFFQEVFVEFFMDNKENDSNIKACKALIDSAKSFLEVMKSFSMVNDPNFEFIKFLREGAKATETLEDIGDKLEKNYLSLSTPNSFIGTKQRVKYVLFSDIRNPLYTLKTDNDFQNLWALNKDWDSKKIIDYNKKVYKDKLELFSIISRIFRSSKYIYLYGSLFSNKGYLQSSLFSDSIDNFQSSK